ncbi:MAG: 2-hydroxyglutaryl-CoA dehydratase [Deltaproteobacteria bacterium]|nr:2-hydroxyglutaryl-CoA dehydratase [Deltaproteobacteria bacterium]
MQKHLPIIDVDAELARFEAEERARLGLDQEREQWIEKMADLKFTREQRERFQTTILVSGLTMAQDYFVQGALQGLGYDVMHLECPDNEALRFGKEFGNRGQCNPTYFTVGNLVKFLCTMRDKHGMSAQEIVDKYIFLTAGACGPCRFGMYVTEYRKALRDAGFDGFRVMLFQQKGGFDQASGEGAPGIELKAPFFLGLIKALVAGDVINALGYRVRPYEIEAGATDRALETVKKNVYEALRTNKSVFGALWTARKELGAVKVDKLRAKPKVSIIGEFWAMTTEGDGNYQLQRFLESEGAEADIQLVTAWILYTIWEGRNDIRDRMKLRGADDARYGLGGYKGMTEIQRTRAVLSVADKATRVVFHVFAWFAGLHGYTLPDMDQIAEVSHRYYNNDLRGGEGHMEVGKLILNVVKQKAHMTLSVKPFGCMPSAGVSDGVQSLITELHPGTIFCPVETSGDGRVNFYSRVQMYLFKAKLAAQDELDEALAQHGLRKEQVQEFLAAHPRFASSLHKSPHAVAGTGADLVHEIAPLMTKTFAQRVADRARRAAEVVFAEAPKVAEQARALWARRDEALAMAREDLAVAGEVVRGKIGEEWLALGKTLLHKHEEEHAQAERPRPAPVTREVAPEAVAAE